MLIDEGSYERLAREAKRRQMPVAAVVREAIDAALPADHEDRREALLAFLAADTIDVPDPEDLTRELDHLRGEKFFRDEAFWS